MSASKYNATPLTTTNTVSPPEQDTPPDSLAEYIETHKLSGRAANDPHQLALADFLFERIQRRANPETEDIEESDLSINADT